MKTTRNYGKIQATREDTSISEMEEFRRTLVEPYISIERALHFMRCRIETMAAKNGMKIYWPGDALEEVEIKNE